jgi:hypothetical protein
MLLAVQLSNDQIAILGCAIVFGGCLVMMMISQKIGESVRGRSRRSEPGVVPFRATRPESGQERKAA